MLRSHKRRSDRSGEKAEFRFSNLQAFKVPKGWDKLFLSIIYMETGKTVAKSSKAIVRGGTCQWTEVESIWISQDDSLNKLEESQFKFVLSVGSSRSAILGEVVLNLADYPSSNGSDPLLLPLNKCESETTLQVKIQFISPKEKFKIAKGLQQRTSHPECLNTNNQGIDSNSNASVRTLNKSMQSLSINHLSGTSCPDECENRDTSSLASSSRYYFDSGTGRTVISPKKYSNGGPDIGRHDSTIVAGHEGELSRSNRSSFNSGTSGSSIHMNQRQDVAVPTSEDGFPTLSLMSHGSVIDMETAEEIEELHDEVKMWERHSRQLKIDIEVLKKEISDKSKSQASLELELAASCREHNFLKEEVEQLKLALKESMSKQTNSVTDQSQGIIFASQNKDIINMQKELEDELKHLKESTANLTLQLRKSQESNIEFVSIIQELEQTIEKQRLKIDNLSQKNHMTEKWLDDEAAQGRKLSKKEDMCELEKDISNVLNIQQPSQIKVNSSHSGLGREIEVFKLKVKELEKKCNELTGENLDITSKMELSKDMRDENFSCSLTSTGSLGFISKSELELNVTELQQENRQLSEHISELEFQLRCMTNAKESNQLELEKSKSLISDLMDKINVNQAEIQMLQIEAKQKLQESQKQLSEALEESDILRRSISESQATINNLLEECNSLQNLTADWKRQKTELCKLITHLELELDESQKKYIGFCKVVEFLQTRFSIQQRDIASEEFLSQLEKLFEEHNVYKEKISEAHGKLNKMESDKKSNVENLRREIAHLTEQMLPVEPKKIASDVKEGSHANGAELGNELSHIHREISEYQRRIQSLEEEKDYFMRKAQLMEKELMLKKEHVVNEKLHEMGMPHASQVDREPNAHQFGLEFAEASITNNMHTVKRSSTEKKIGDAEDLDKKMRENDTTRTCNAGRISSLEAELKDMKERYLRMSLQYAEVEAQREELVWKLKSMQKLKR
ncbi:myosin-11-like [Canna indica]|uniref:Myosin-11-like n=1 Tax=Canna indica TaxID=4628 RepID=A0AAQ3K0D6_9LILI|nr:myosin-11-like [Canna indica]